MAKDPNSDSFLSNSGGEKTPLSRAFPAIARRDFLGGVSAGTILGLIGTDVMATPAIAAQVATAAPDAADYPPVRTGLRGQYPGSFEVAHDVRDGDFAGPVSATDTGEHYDLVVVGAGISGLSAAHFWRRALDGNGGGPGQRILILDNHDDFGGHAKRNEFHVEGRTIVTYGGTMSIETPFPYSYTAKGLLAELGIDPTTQAKYDKSATVFAGMGAGVFFDKAHFGVDKMVPGFGKRPYAEFFADAPLSPVARADLIRLFTEKRDWLPGLTPEARADALKKISYQDFLVKHVGIGPDALKFFAGHGYRNNMRVDTCPAWVAMRNHAPGFSGMEIAEAIEAESANFHFPDGNASVARLLVNRLVPDAIPDARDMDSVVAARADYSKLDVAGRPVRIRLSSIVVRVEHPGEAARTGMVPTTVEKAVRIVYAKPDGTRASVSAGGVVLACFNNIIPFMVPELPAPQREALRYASKVPMQYTSVVLRNAHALNALGVRSVQSPFGYHGTLLLDQAISVGGYAAPASIDDPVVVKLIRNPNAPGLSRKDQNRAGRGDMLATPFATSEREVRAQLQGMLGSAGFDHKRDILAITVNRWPHGYAYTYDTLGDPDVPERDRPHVIGRQPWGRITIANADSAAQAFTNAAIDMGHRAVGELLVARGLT
ncbi:NAD(P)-binding protein [Novosphingobium sp.]|uniref:NAD(P)-binding protein n=1 Tax=Novosphingobium sp. TaxID=1874826 RepID=UPI003B5302ED